MAAPTVADMLKYANLQMAAEALFDFNTKKRDPASLLPGDHYVGPIQVNWLTDGNEHGSRFAPTEAAKFVTQWEVVDHLSNTTTGFSGTLFRALKNDPAQNVKAGDLVLSIRSTEFIDDSVRDSYGTNKLEIKDRGWAFGQISDMEAWYKTLKVDGVALSQKHYSVTGYSLGGHLATAFNLLRQEDGSIGNVDNVVTFNGAGVGQVTSGTLGTLGGAIKLFDDLRASDTLLKGQFTDSRLGDLYQQLRATLADGHKPAAGDYALLDTVTAKAYASDYEQARFAAEKVWLRTALDNIKSLKEQVAYMSTITDAKDGDAAKIPDSRIAQEGFAYQMALLIASEKTKAMATPLTIVNGVIGKTPGSPQLANQHDIVGRETTSTQTAMVAYSQLHYGTDVSLFIEDQPFTRGSFTKSFVTTALTQWEIQLLQNQYAQNNFADTHSLVLLVDSLAIQNTLLQLVPAADRETQTAKMTDYLKAASAANDANERQAA